MILYSSNGSTVLDILVSIQKKSGGKETFVEDWVMMLDITWKTCLFYLV